MSTGVVAHHTDELATALFCYVGLRALQALTQRCAATSANDGDKSGDEAHSSPLVEGETLILPSSGVGDSPRTRILTRLCYHADKLPVGGRYFVEVAPGVETFPSLAAAPAFDRCMVYLHGFPDQSLDHRRETTSYGQLSTRLPQKLCHNLCQEFPNAAFVALNFSGTPGSEAICEHEDAFFSKTVTREVADVKLLLAFLRLQVVPAPLPIHIVGISTGAIIASLLRDCGDPDITITAIAGLVDVEAGLRYDFDGAQLAAFDTEGFCLKEFWLPVSSPSNPPHVQQVEPLQDDSAFKETKVWQKQYLRLGAQYRDDFLGLDIHSAVQRGGAPFLVIHGDKDRSVPMDNGQALFAAAAEPKQLLVIKGGDHLLRSTKHFQKASSAIMQMVRNYEVRAA